MNLNIKLIQFKLIDFLFIFSCNLNSSQSFLWFSKTHFIAKFFPHIHLFIFHLTIYANWQFISKLPNFFRAYCIATTWASDVFHLLCNTSLLYISLLIIVSFICANTQLSTLNIIFKYSGLSL